MTEQLKILHWNCQGLGNKKLEILQFIQHHKIHIILLNETHLNPKIAFKLPNYHTYRNDRATLPGQRSAGGTAILVLNRLIHYETIIPTNSIENTTVQIQINHHETRLSAVYKRPGTILHTADIDLLLDTESPTIIAGDLNSKHPAWNSRLANQAGLAPKNHMNHRDYIIVAPDSPTRIPDQQNQLPDVLDIAILNKIHLTYDIVNFTDVLFSDHNPVIQTLQGKPSSSQPVTTRKITNWPRFAVDLHCAINSPNPVINSIAELDQAVSNFTTLVKTSMTKNTTVLDS
ncbi:unnamed protein product [Macrosiphum euphorbiae]|uniref:Endonuclease/exonuclease/phosphatase domain-containing protein n=1 Tax=Macrosiphum euphorbiae TaxID=13131 RepID=A0AAV0WQN4_9HEMI|nr:unnamed protein product [Macrosiphum euphorbiae]